MIRCPINWWKKSRYLSFKFLQIYKFFFFCRRYTSVNVAQPWSVIMFAKFSVLTLDSTSQRIHIHGLLIYERSVRNIMAQIIYICILRRMLKAGDPVDLKLWTKSGEIQCWRNCIPLRLQLLSRYPAVQVARLAPDTPGPHLLHLRDQRPGNILVMRLLFIMFFHFAIIIFEFWEL